MKKMILWVKVYSHMNATECLLQRHLRLKNPYVKCKTKIKAHNILAINKIVIDV